MPSLAVAPVTRAQRIMLAHRHLIAGGQLPAWQVTLAVPAAAPGLTPIGTTYVWCGQPIYDLDITQQIGLAELHSPCAEQFDAYPYGDVVSVSMEGTQ